MQRNHRLCTLIDFDLNNPLQLTVWKAGGESLAPSTCQDPLLMSIPLTTDGFSMYISRCRTRFLTDYGIIIVSIICGVMTAVNKQLSTEVYGTLY